MATHYVSSSNPFEFIKLTKNFTSTSQVLEILPSNSQITLLDEYVGLDCSYNYVSSSTQVGFVKSSYVFPLSGTAPSAPYVCYNTIPNFAYVKPEWQLLTEDQPYIDELTNEYCICITSDSLTLNADESLVLRRGVESLCKYYNKPHDDVSLDTYLSYYIFAKINDYYVPFRPLMRTKYLVCVARKYFDAIEEDKRQTTTPLNGDLSKVDTLLEIDLKEAAQKFNSLGSILGLYNTDVVVSNTTLVYSYSGGQSGIQNDLVNEINFLEKKENIQNFKQKLDDLLSLNEINPNPSVTMIDEIYIQFAIDGECNKLYDVAVKINGECKKLRVGIESFLRSESVMDNTTINFVKYIHNINQIDKCKVPWYDFAEQYVYPPVIVKAPADIADQPSYELFRKLFNLFLSFQAKNAVNPAKTYQQIYDEQAELLTTQLTQYFTLGASPFIRLLYQADNSVDPTNLDKTMRSLESSISQSPLSTQDSFAVKNEDGIYITAIGSGENWTLGEPSNIDVTTYKIDTENPSVTINGINYTLYKSSKADQAVKKVNDGGDFIRTQLNRIYNFVNKIGICKLTDLALGCLLSLARSIGIDVDTTLTLSVMKNYKYDKIINDIIPYLPPEQQQFLYEQLLLELGCINSDSLLYTLKNYLSSSEYTTLNLDNASYEDIVKEVSKRMVIQVVST